MIEITFLADRPEGIPTLTAWFRTQWPDYFAGRTAADIARDFRSEANRDSLPVRLVAYADGELAGTVTLRDKAIDTSPGYRPGLGGLYVVDSHRGRGIGTALVCAGMDLARDQGYERVYVATATARGIMERLGWQLIQTVAHGDEQQLVYGYDLAENDEWDGTDA